MINVNEVTLIGTLACQPVFSTMAGGSQVCKFYVDTVDKIQNTTRISRHNVSVIGRLCDVVSIHGVVGRSVLIKGRLEYWHDENRNRLVDVKAQFAEFAK